MRILCLFKRRYMRKDVIVDRYARLYELPLALARRGHQIDVMCLNYHGRGAPFVSRDEQGDGRLHWYSCDSGPLLLPGLLTYARAVKARIARLAPHILLGGSDSPHVVMTRHFARAAGLPYAVDLFDNYAAFGLSRLPGMDRAYRRALAEANAISCVSEPLHAMVKRNYRPRGTLMTLESTINHAQFHPHERAASRAALGLPPHARLIGTAGALDASRGIATLYRAYERLRAERDDVYLVLAGSRTGAEALPQADGVLHLGELPHDRIPALFSALDLAVICMRDTPFGRYAFPQKAYEIIACQTPLVAARVGALASLLGAVPHGLYEPDDVDSLTDCLRGQLDTPSVSTVVPPDWTQQAARLETLLAGTIASGAS